MAEKSKDTQQMRVYTEDIDRLKNFGRVGDSMADALSRALDLAEGKIDNPDVIRTLADFVKKAVKRKREREEQNKQDGAKKEEA